MRRTQTIRYSAAFTAGLLALAACTNGGNGDDGAAGDQDNGDAGAETGDDAPAEVEPLSIHANTANSYVANFNPFASSVLSGTRGLIYEPLVIFTPMNPGEGEPWLAESIEFNEDGTVATITVRDGIEWSDGEAFTADDVAYTFNLKVEEPATNIAALDIVEATAVDEHTVEVTFGGPQFAFEPAIGNTFIVPEHIWAEQDAPIEFANEDPVGTGPFVLDHFGDQLYTFAKSDSYWQAADYLVEEVRYPANTTETFNAALQGGELDWSGGFVANIDQIFVDHDPENRGYWFPGDGLVNLFLNHETEPFDDLAVREAISAAIDRNQISEVAMQAYTPPAHPSGLPLPTFEDVMAPEFEDLAYEYDTDAANQILDDAGYELGDDGVRVTPDGERMVYALEVPSGYVDWVTITQLLEEQLGEVGIRINPQGVSFESWLENRNNGNYGMTIASVATGLSPFYLYRSILSSEYRPTEDSPTVSGNFARFYSDEADEHFNTLRTTDDDTELQDALEGLQRIMVEELPIIPMLQSPNWFQYNTERWEGFPNEEDPYALGAPYQFPDNLLIIRNLTPAN